MIFLINKIIKNIIFYLFVIYINFIIIKNKNSMNSPANPPTKNKWRGTLVKPGRARGSYAPLNFLSFFFVKNILFLGLKNQTEDHLPMLRPPCFRLKRVIRRNWNRTDLLPVQQESHVTNGQGILFHFL